MKRINKNANVTFATKINDFSDAWGGSFKNWPYRYFYFNHIILPNTMKSNEGMLSNLNLINKDTNTIFVPNNNDFFDEWGG